MKGNLSALERSEKLWLCSVKPKAAASSPGLSRGCLHPPSPDEKEFLSLGRLSDPKLSPVTLGVTQLISRGTVNFLD